MTSEERRRLEQLDRILRSQQVRAQILPIVERVRTDLSGKKKAVMAWEPIPLTTFENALSSEIRSAWVFILRAGTNTGAERHPNSHQRMMSFEGKGDLRTALVVPRLEGRIEKDEDAAEWQTNVLGSDPEAPLERRWISIPPNVWHQPVVGEGADWVVVSFHTVSAEELIEERPDSRRDGGTKQARYLDEK